jgi:hypothetical protein
MSTLDRIRNTVNPIVLSTAVKLYNVDKRVKVIMARPPFEEGTTVELTVSSSGPWGNNVNIPVLYNVTEKTVTWYFPSILLTRFGDGVISITLADFPENINISDRIMVNIDSIFELGGYDLSGNILTIFSGTGVFTTGVQVGYLGFSVSYFLD